MLASNRSINIDITYRCPLECPLCPRQESYRDKGLKVPGRDLPVEKFKELMKHFNSFNFCGQLSDPIHHPKFKEILALCYEDRAETFVHTASSLKPFNWYIEAFKANPHAKWIFGIDGLPEESCMYRVNQDGEKLFKVMLESKKYLKQPPKWQYIIFSYNEDNIEEAQALAMESGVEFMTVQSSRWSNGKIAELYKPRDPSKRLATK